MRQSLTEPAFDAARRNQDQLLGEWIGQRIGQQGAETVGKEIGALGTMQMKRHRGATIDLDTDAGGCLREEFSSLPPRRGSTCPG